MLIHCPECGKEISDQAASCPNCGCPQSVWIGAAPLEAETTARDEPESADMSAESAEQSEGERAKDGRGFLIFAAITIAVMFFFTLLTLSGSPSSAGGSSGSGKKSYSTDDYKSACYSLAEKQVKKHLKAPSTASFCRMSEASFSKDEENTYVMTGWVDAENSFGAKLRSNWGIKVKVSSEKMTMVRLIIDGETVYP